MNRVYRKHISSGGRQDKLALTLLLWQIEHKQELPVYRTKCIR